MSVPASPAVIDAWGIELHEPTHHDVALGLTKWL
jgi:hypothetical protein